MNNSEIWNIAARKKLGAPDTWIWCKVQQITGGILITGAVPLGITTRGKNKGRPKWPKLDDCDMVIVTKEDIENELANYKKEVE